MIKTVKKNIDPISKKLCSYQLTMTDSNLVKSVPIDEKNLDYILIKEWEKDGNKIEEAD